MFSDRDTACGGLHFVGLLSKLILLAMAILLSLFPASPIAAQEQVDYSKDIKPILVKRCFRCHSSLKQEGGLRMDSIAALTRGGDSGQVISAGDSASSLLIEVISGDEDTRMPPEGDPLTPGQIALLKAWVDQGAKTPEDGQEGRDHWAFQSPTLPEIPQTKNRPWVITPIDAFIAAAHEKQKLNPAPSASKQVLLRRVYLDLIGIPPTPQQLQVFLADESPSAYERVVDELLASPRYGERWGRHWMDVWRYSDWSGYRKEVRVSQPHIWRWRDWIIDSLNHDKNYDRMIVEMLAADEVAPNDPDALRATGYLVRNWYKFNRNVWMDATLDHTCKAFLGVSMGCARCHDHMYDPISHEEYYRFRAFFEPHNVRTDRVPGQANTTKNGLVHVFDAQPDATTYLFKRGDDRYPDKSRAMVPALPKIFGGTLPIEEVSLPATAYYPGLRQFEQEESIKQALAKQQASDQAVSRAKARPNDSALAVAKKKQQAAHSQLKSVRARIAADKARYGIERSAEAQSLATAAAKAQRLAALHAAEADLAQAELDIPAAQAAKQKNPKDAALVKKLAAAQKKAIESGKKIKTAQANMQKESADYSPFGKIYPQKSTGRRKALAQWIASKNNPLTARVAVNHMWMRRFGRPLAGSMVDLGQNSQDPIAPELLDWLAMELMRQDWRMKPLHRMMVLSNVYRMQSWGGDSDGSNQEIDPDNLYLWRMRSRRMEAEVIRDSLLFVTDGLDFSMGGPELDHNAGQTIYRRSIYFRHAAEKQMTFLKLFDVANVTECYRRSESIVPQQALALANSPLAVTRSRVLAGKLSKQSSDKIDASTDAAFINRAFQRILGRLPSSEEDTQCKEFITAQSKRLAAGDQLSLFTSGPKNPVPPAADAHQRARENLVQVLLNHNDFITIR